MSTEEFYLIMTLLGIIPEINFYPPYSSLWLFNGTGAIDHFK